MGHGVILTVCPSLPSFPRKRTSSRAGVHPKGGVVLLCPARYPPQPVAACLSRAARRILSCMGTKSRETIYGTSVRAAAERAAGAQTSRPPDLRRLE